MSKGTFNVASNTYTLSTGGNNFQPQGIASITGLANYTSGLFVVNVTSANDGQFYIGLCPIDPQSGNWVDTYVAYYGGTVTPPNDGGYIGFDMPASTTRTEGVVVPLHAQSYEVVWYSNSHVGPSLTLSATLLTTT